MESETYHLRSGDPERERDRLDRGHRAILNITGDLLPPSIAVDYTAPLKVADVGTGTGAWLVQLHSILSPRSTLVGFDITSVQFPSTHDVPPNVSFRTRDIRQPFSIAEIGTYDIVHARLLMYAFKADEWAPLVSNLTTLLRPGGYLFFEDTNYDSWACIPSSAAWNRLVEIDQRASLQAGRDLKYIGKMERHFRAAGLLDITKSTHSSSDQEEDIDHQISTALMLRVHEQSLKGAVAKGGVEGCRTAADVTAVVGAISKDVESGTEIIVNIRRFVGRKGS